MVNHTYLFLLGRNEELSLAELRAVFPDVHFEKKFDGFFEGNVVLDTPQKFLDRIGGVLQILEVIKDQIPVNDLGNVLFEILKEKFHGQASKVTFGLNAYGNLKNSLRKYLLDTKKNLKAGGLKVRFVNKNFQNVARGVIFEEKLISEGMDLSIFPNGTNVIIAKTVALQDVEGYEKRDYGKPYRDAKAGMLPPKLAQMMINISVGNKKFDGMIFDPFCGTGTVLMEAMLMGYPAIGSDMDLNMVEGAKKNLEWLGKNGHIFHEDARKITAEQIIPHLSGKKLAVVTEPYLGPPLTHAIPSGKLNQIMAELETLYLDFFQNLKKWIPKETAIVFLFPCFRVEKSWQFLPGIVEKIKALGYSEVALSQSGRLIYERPDQMVGRVITKFIPG